MNTKNIKPTNPHWTQTSPNTEQVTPLSTSSSVCERKREREAIPELGLTNQARGGDWFASNTRTNPPSWIHLQPHSLSFWFLSPTPISDLSFAFNNHFTRYVFRDHHLHLTFVSLPPLHTLSSWPETQPHHHLTPLLSGFVLYFFLLLFFFYLVSVKKSQQSFSSKNFEKKTINFCFFFFFFFFFF